MFYIRSDNNKYTETVKFFNSLRRNFIVFLLENQIQI